MKILIATDYYGLSSFNGMAIYSTSLARELTNRGFEVIVVSSNNLKPPSNVPSLKEHVIKEDGAFMDWCYKIDAINPDKIFIMSEESVGVYVRQWALKRNREYFTLFSTKYPEFFEIRGQTPPYYSYFKWFHSKSKKIIVPTLSVKYELLAKYWSNDIEVMAYGTNKVVFNPNYPPIKDHEYLLYVGRLALDKNVVALANLNTYNLPLYVIGTGPLLSKFTEIVKENKNIILVGPKNHGPRSAEWYSGAKAMIFTSKLDTFGLTITESLLCGTPVAAFDAPGPRDILRDKRLGHVNDDLQHALDRTLVDGNTDFCRDYAAEEYSIEASADRFLKIITA